MKLILATLALVTCFFATPAELDDLIKEFENDSFDKREAASAKLSEYPEEYAKKFLQMADKATDPEVRERLRVCAKNVYFNKMLPKQKRWRELYGRLPFDAHRVFRQEEFTKEDGTVSNEYGCRNVIVRIPDDSTSLHEGDIIIKCDKMEVARIGVLTLADEEYEFTVRRWKGEALEKILSTLQPPDGDEDYSEMKIKVKARWGTKNEIDAEQARDVFDNLWNTYYNLEVYPPPPDEKIEKKPDDPKAEIVPLEEDAS